MSQITLKLDEATQALVEQAAAAQGVSQSRWVEQIIRKYAAQNGWPEGCIELAGRFPDFPLREDAPTPAEDIQRLGFSQLIERGAGAPRDA